MSTIVNREQLTEVLGLSKSRITQLVREGMPKIALGKFDGARCCRWYIDFKTRPAKDSTDVLEARQRLYDAQLVKTKLETGRQRDELIPADEVLRDMHQLQAIVDAELEPLPATLAQELARLTDPAAVQNCIMSGANRARTRIADALEDHASEL